MIAVAVIAAVVAIVIADVIATVFIGIGFDKMSRMLISQSTGNMLHPANNFIEKFKRIFIYANGRPPRRLE